MIKQYTGMKAEKTVGNTPLPAGGYVAEIKKAKVEEYSWGSVVVVAFDIAEGEYKGFFQKQYDSNPNEDKKWKGTYRITVPDESSKFFQSNQRTFNNFIYALEDSNKGYHYDCDEKKFSGKSIGVIFRDKQWKMNGRDGWTTECGAVTDVTAIRENTFKQLKPKPLDNGSNETANMTNPSATDFVDDDLPF